ncbi:tRNA (N6-isopentenyl adenosine(37)-C2)-methylthiotransferase MiaB [Candidatus Uhrbacteria bacterium]|jgi:tRNA-2-methylthio-N6-dimethylallyladenosine synthase|nr:tRNA (N6-isopentenyl adenosine(37)-C2)-methylthiotransferase MiaB [Candidatus Uhrbacteria bacterium]
MNKNDSERMETLLQGVGLVRAEEEGDADVILINTCSVRQSAEDRVFGKVKALNKIKKKKPDLIVGVTGCMAGRDRDGAIRKRLPIVDLYFPTKDMGQLPRWIGEIRPELVNSTDAVEDYLKVKPEYHSKRQAFVSIQTGCNKFCTYCVVPFARGLEKNRPILDIMNEIRELVAHGCVEITLLGQTVNSYIAPDPENFSANNPYEHHFARILWEVNQVEGVTRLHFTAPHPLHMTDEVIDAMALPAHLNFIHLPVQSGDDEVLRRMNRRYTAAEFIEVIDRLRAKIPNLAIGTDIIVGFCGESEEQFQKTVELFKRADFDISYTAQYSTRSGTAAARAFKDDVSREEKKRRWEVLQKLMEGIVYKKNQRFVGEIVSVLVDRHEPPKVTDEMLAMPEKIQELMAAQPGLCYGQSRELKLTRFPGGEEYVGQIVDVKVTRADKWLLEGEVV